MIGQNGIPALLTDLYELTMMQGYLLSDNNPEVVFDVFFRRQPFRGGFSVFAGLEDVIRALCGLRFSGEDLAYLASLGHFRGEFLDYLSAFRFRGDLYSMDEGTVVFPNEPLMRVHGRLVETQLIESVLLAIVNFQTLIATKAARMRLASRGGRVVEFGLRRAQGVDGAVSAARAAFIGGAQASSNVLAGKLFGIPVSGTMAHSWVMAFETEAEAFDRYADLYPDASIFLIDTYDTLGSGIENAIRVGKRLQARGKTMGVRLDSGDLEYLSKRVRERLDGAGLKEASIFVSNELNEQIIQQLVAAGAPIDGWGVGTELVTGGSESALSGVYKLVAKRRDGLMKPTIKISNNPEKTTTPGIKQVHRFYDAAGAPIADLLSLVEEELPARGPVRFYHPMMESTYFNVSDYGRVEPLLSRTIRSGEREREPETLPAIQERAAGALALFDESFKRILNPHLYKVSLTKALVELKFGLMGRRRG